MKYQSFSHYFTWKHWALIYTLLAVVSFLPLLCIVIATTLSQALGCGDINYGAAPDCRGGSVLYTFFVMGWFGGLVTFPFGGFLAILLIIANLLWYFTRKSGEDITSF